MCVGVILYVEIDMVVHKLLTKEERAQFLGTYASNHRLDKLAKDSQIQVISTEELTSPTLESLATESFVSSDYSLNTMVNGEREISMVETNRPQIKSGIPLSNVLHQITFYEEKNNPAEVSIDVKVEKEVVKGQIYMQNRDMYSYTQAAHFLKKVMIAHGAERNITMNQLLEIGYDHMSGMDEFSQDGYTVQFELKPELTRITLSVGDSNLPLKHTEVLDQESGFQVKMCDDLYTRAEYSKNPMRDELDLPVSTKYMGQPEEVSVTGFESN